MADKDREVNEDQPEREAPPVRWNETVNSGWYISNEMFRRIARTGEFSPTEEKPAEPKAAPSA